MAVPAAGGDKKRQRGLLAERRRAYLCPGAAVAVARRFMRHFMPAPGVVVAATWPLAEELDTRPLLWQLTARGCILALPRVVGADRPLVFCHWPYGAPLTAGIFGTRYPLSSRALPRVDITCVPLLGFDRAGYRLGYGGGYYDRSLGDRGACLAVGLAFSVQEVARIVRDPWDERLDFVLTESEVIDCRGPGRMARGEMPGG